MRRNPPSAAGPRGADGRAWRDGANLTPGVGGIAYRRPVTADRPPTDAARAAALDALARVRADRAYANLVLPGVLRQHGLTGRDAAFATELVAGTIRGQGTYDAVLASCVARSLARLEPLVLDALRMGTHQLLGMRVPPHAAINSTVDLVRARVGERVVGFTNAVLRAVAERDADGWMRRLAPAESADRIGHAAVVHSHPRWVVEEVDRALGPAQRELGDALAANNEPPRVTLVARPGQATREELGGTPTRFSPYGVTLDHGDPAAVPAVAEGRAGVQDEGSQLVAIAAATAPVTGPDNRWLDLCAAPGGKAALLAALAAPRGAVLVAVDRQPRRAGLVARALAGAPGTAGAVCADGRTPAWRPRTFDRVLVDAPCSGLGSLRRRPESRWRHEREDLDRLVRLQTALLHAAVDAVRRGGIIAYATCTPVLVETAGVVQRVLEDRTDVALEDAPGLLPQVPDAGGDLDGTVQLWPHRHGTDAMFLAVLRRVRR